MQVYDKRAFAVRIKRIQKTAFYRETASIVKWSLERTDLYLSRNRETAKVTLPQIVQMIFGFQIVLQDLFIPF
jgi:hypothetical protein